MRRYAGVVVACVLGACSFQGSGGGVGDGDGDGGPDVADAADGSSPDGAGPDAMPLTLVDTGLVLRYFIDEAASGQGPTALVDSASNPLDLTITYGQATYIDDGNRGLSWQAALGTGKIEEPLSTTKLSTALRTSMRVTIEVVVDIDDTGDGVESQITGMRGSNPDFMLTAINDDELRFRRPFGTLGATWAASNDGDRMVLHLVFDTTQVDAQRRIDLYKNGALLTKTTSSPPGLNTTVGLGGSDDFMIGNRQNQDQSIGGVIYYVAYYNQSLSGSDIANNSARLLASDDQ